MSEIIVEVGDRHIREINEEIQVLCKKNPIRSRKLKQLNLFTRYKFIFFGWEECDAFAALLSPGAACRRRPCPSCPSRRNL